MCLQYNSFENMVGKEEIVHNKKFLLFQSFLSFQRTFRLKFKILSKLFQFGRVWNLSFGKWFNSLPNNKTLHWSKLKAFADDKINVNENLKFGLGKVENIFFLKFVVKRKKMLVTSIFSFSQNVFKSLLLQGFCNKQFLLFRKCFLSFRRTFCHFHQI